MATTKRTRKKPPPRPKRSGYVFVRLSGEEEAMFRAVAPFEPLAAAVRRLALERAATMETGTAKRSRSTARK